MSESLKCVSWNCNILPNAAQYFAKDPEDRIKKLLDFIRDQFSEYQVIGLQELFSSEIRSIVKADLEQQGFNVFSADEQDKEWGSGLVTAVKSKVLEVRSEKFKNRALEDLCVQKGMLGVRMKTEQGEIEYINTHMQPYFIRWARFVRGKQITQLADFISTSSSDNQIIGGDLNVDRLGLQTGGVNDEFKSLCSQLAVAPLDFDLTEATYTSIGHPDKPKKAGKWPDHFFVKGDIAKNNKVKAMIVDHTKNSDPANFSTDHHPISLDLRAA